MRKSRLKNLRKPIFLSLNPLASSKKGLSTTNRVLTCIIILAVSTTILETEIAIRETIPKVFLILNIFFITIFSIEYIVRVWVEAERPEHRGFTGRLKYVFSFWSLIDLLAIIPFILTLGTSDTLLLRFFRLFRLLSLAKLGKYSKSLQNIINAITIRKHELILSVGAVFVVMLISSITLYLTEGATNPQEFGSVPRAFWWGAATVSKVGYGGAYPETVLGQLFAIVFAVAAIGIVAVPTGIIAGSFYEAFSKKKKITRNN